jgi:diguanylate cyclase (GGDEF)-like protein/PAS domain S-box-containing protein
MAVVDDWMVFSGWLVLAGLAIISLCLAVLFSRRLHQLGELTETMRGELEDSRSRYRLLAENASDVIWTARLPDLKYSYISPSITRLRGLSVDEAMQETLPESLVPEQREWIRKLVDRRVERFRQGRFDQTEAQRVKVRQQCVDGHEITVEIIGSLIVDEDGEVVGLQGISRNVTARQRAEQARQSREQILSALARGARLLFNSDEKEQALADMLAGLGKAVGVDRVYVFENHHHPESGRLLASQRYEWVGKDIEAQLDNPSMQDMDYEAVIPNWYPLLARDQAVHGLVEDLPAIERDLLEPQGILSIAVVPIFNEGQFWGQIGFDDCTRKRSWHQAEIDALGIAAATVGAAIRGIRAEQKLRHQANTDSLTGLHSRRVFLQRARQAHEDAVADGESLALMIMDLDHFKSVNDNHGHPVGDVALQAFARVCRETLRDDDVVGRMGGEEFAVLLARVDYGSARDVAEKLRRRVEATPVHAHGVKLMLTVSMGLALSCSEEDFSEWLKRADLALYQAKNGGRNQVAVAR